ncbi:MAG: transglycosylase SLT domain-containing protein [Campylobacteraceae bacterium]|jgi:soluble lytic murein transglycosylase|nr:transglycosylase SLT domain-containing protein [Campylobacteraceae bacterium]
MPFKSLFLLFFLCISTLFGTALNYQELTTKPRSIAKDYYIYRLLLEGNASKEEIGDLYMQVNRLNQNLKNQFAKKIDINANQTCKPLSVNNALKSGEECLVKLLTPQFVEPLDIAMKTALANKLRQHNNFTANWISALNSKKPFRMMEQKLLTEEFLKVFNQMPASYKKKLNFPLTKEFLYQMELLPYPYETFVKYIVLNADDFKKPLKSLLYTPKNDALTHKTLFYLGINALKANDTALSSTLFEKAAKRAYFRSDMDKALFFQYLSSGDKDLLKNIGDSFDINIYSLYAREMLNTTTKNITFLSPSYKKAAHKFDMQDPFEWYFLLNKIQGMDKDEIELLAVGFDAPDTLPVYAFLLTRIANYKHHYFIIPYEEHLKDFDAKRKALILSIARQESGFITSAVSASYALGMMQFLPSVASDIAAKQNIKDFDWDDMFKPETAYNFADTHLNYLNKYLYHPLFTAYAYNGGIGYTKKMLSDGKLFNSGKYEPFLSIELLQGEESREYGKKVLANYLIYMQHLGEKITLKELLETLTKPAQTDKFRQKD